MARQKKVSSKHFLNRRLRGIDFEGNKYFVLSVRMRYSNKQVEFKSNLKSRVDYLLIGKKKLDFKYQIANEDLFLTQEVFETPSKDLLRLMAIELSSSISTFNHFLESREINILNVKMTEFIVSHYSRPVYEIVDRYAKRRLTDRLNEVLPDIFGMFPGLGLHPFLQVFGVMEKISSDDNLKTRFYADVLAGFESLVKLLSKLLLITVNGDFPTAIDLMKEQNLEAFMDDFNSSMSKNEIRDVLISALEDYKGQDEFLFMK